MLVKAVSAAERLEDPFGGTARARPTITATDIATDKLLLQGSRLESNLADAITGTHLERTIEGASTLTIDTSDPERLLHGSGMLLDSKGRLAPLHLAIPGPRRAIHFLLAKLAKAEDGFAFTFEDREVAWLRRYDKPRKAYRDRVTRAEFVLSLIREVKEGRIRTYIPELHKRQPRAPIKRPTDRKKGDSEERTFGLSHNLVLKIKGARATPFQLHNVERALNVGVSLGAPELALMAALVAGIGESLFRFPVNSLGYGGVFQGQVETGGHYFAKDDVEGMARFFFLGGKGFGAGGAIKLAKANPRMSPGTIATKVEVSGVSPSVYDVHKDEARALLTAYGGKRLKPGGTVSGTIVKRFAFTRGTGGKREDSWIAVQRHAEEVRWRAFMNEGVFYFISEDDLFRFQPRMVISEDSPGVDWIDYDIDVGKHVNEATVRCRAGLWAADPGTAVLIDEEGNPAAGEPWIVSTVARDGEDPACEVTIKRPSQPKIEPAPETESATISRAEARRRRRASSAGSAASVYDKVYDEAIRISKKNYPYSWGGGHGKLGQPGGPHNGLDCSGYVSACLGAAGLLDAPLASPSLEHWGEPGPGKHFTVFANSQHTYIEFYGRAWQRADTSAQGSGGPGPHVRKGHRGDHGSFTARHWKGE